MLDGGQIVSEHYFLSEIYCSSDNTCFYQTILKTTCRWNRGGIGYV